MGLRVRGRTGTPTNEQFRLRLAKILCRSLMGGMQL